MDQASQVATPVNMRYRREGRPECIGDFRLNGGLPRRLKRCDGFGSVIDDGAEQACGLPIDQREIGKQYCGD